MIITCELPCPGCKPSLQNGPEQGPDQDGLAGAGLTGQGGHAAVEFHVDLIDNGEVADVYVGQHLRRLFHRKGAKDAKKT